MKKILFIFILCILVSYPFQAAYPDIPYTIINIDHPSNNETYARDINNIAQITGFYSVPYPNDYYGFILWGDVWHYPTPQIPEADQVFNLGINDAGSLVGLYCTSSYCYNFFYHDDDFMPIAPPCPSASRFSDLNNYYWIAGYCGSGETGFIQSGASPSLYALFSFPGESRTHALGINDNYVIVGYGYGTGLSYFGTVTGGFSSFQVSGAPATWAYGINNGGQIVGEYYWEGHSYGFVREKEGKIATIHVPNSDGTAVYGINEFRQLVGIYVDSAWKIHAFLAIPDVNPQPADLVVSEIVTDPPYPSPGEQIDVHVTVENQGAYDAGGFFLDWYANESSAPSPPPFGDQREYVPGLAAGATYTMSTTWTYSTQGTYQMYAYPDTGYGVYESDENNNVLGPVEILVGISACECGLIPDDAIIPRGGTLGLTATVTNNTGSDQTVKFATRVKLPNGNMYPTGSHLFGPKNIPLSPYAYRSGHLSHNIPLTAPLGIYTYYGYVANDSLEIIHQCEIDFEVTASGEEGEEAWETLLDQEFIE